MPSDSQSPMKDKTQPFVIVDSRESGNQCCSGLGGPRRCLVIVVIYALIITGLGIFMAKLSIGIPGLDKQIAKLEAQKKELQTQIGTLAAEIDELTYQVDRLGNETEYLSDINDALNSTVNDLKLSVKEYTLENDRLNSTVHDFREENEKLNATIAQNIALIASLDQEVEQLAGNVTSLNDTVSLLEINLSNANTVNDLLTSNVNALTLTNLQMNNTQIQLRSDLNSTQTVVKQLEAVNRDLSKILSYLNDTGKYGLSFDTVRAELASAIKSDQELVYRNVFQTYKMKLSNIPCNFGKAFATSSWMTNMNRAIGAVDYPKVKSFLNENYFSEVCANMTDFETFVVRNTDFAYIGPAPPVNATVNLLNAAMGIYFDKLMLYYFPANTTSTEKSLSLDDWVVAKFSCNNIPANKSFAYFT